MKWKINKYIFSRNANISGHIIESVLSYMFNKPETLHFHLISTILHKLSYNIDFNQFMIMLSQKIIPSLYEQAKSAVVQDLSKMCSSTDD